MLEIIESQMLFGPYEKNRVFQIEKSDTYNCLPEKIKTVEFILICNENNLNFIEAKSSSPKPIRENIIRFDEFVKDVSEKFIHSFNLYYSTIVGRQEKFIELSDKFLQLDNRKITIKFLLIIKGHKIEWLPAIHEELERKLYCHNKIWKIDIAVLNDELAIRHKLVGKVLD